MPLSWPHPPIGVLLVSEDDALQGELRHALSDVEKRDDGQAKVRLEVARTWPEALRLLPHEPLAAVLVDWHAGQPTLSQLERELIALPGPPLVILVAKADEPAAVAALQAGAADYLVKETLGSDCLLRSLRHVAERARIYRELAELSRRTVDSQQDVAAFVANIGSGLEGDWASLLRQSQRLRNLRQFDQAALNESAERLEEVAHRARTAIDTLLSFADAGLTSAASQTEVVPALKDVIHDLRPLANDLSAEVELDADNVSVTCALGSFSAIARHLIVYALESMDGQPVRRVLISAHEHDNNLILAVADTGLGIPSAGIEDIFEPKASNPLALVKRLVAAHAGQIEVHSTLGEGTTFQVRLPLV